MMRGLTGEVCGVRRYLEVAVGSVQRYGLSVVHVSVKAW